MFDNLFSLEWWLDQAQRLYNLLLPVVGLAISGGVQGGTDALLSMGVAADFALTNEAVLELARTYTYNLVSGITETSRAYLQETIAQWIATGGTMAELEATLAGSGLWSANRASMIAVTETTRLFAEGNIAAWKESGVVEGKRWETARDDLVCPICEPLAGMVVSLNSDGFTTESGGLGVYAPPGHPACRCYLMPFVEIVST